MKNPDQLSLQLTPDQVSPTWPRPDGVQMCKDPVQVCGRRRLKRKSREPQRLCRDLDSDRTMTAPGDRSDLDSGDDSAPPNTHLVESRCGGLLSGLTEGGGALDMRITPRLSQAPPPPFAEISHWTPSISHRLRLGLRSTPLLENSTPALPTSLPATPHVPHAPQDQLEPQVVSSQESPRKRAGLNADGHGRVPEVKAIQQTRRLLANARERTRVHTISAAFEALRKQVPCYSYGQKLSKLAILRIACNYILSLAQLAELDYSSDRASLSFSQCVDQCTRTLQAEGRSKKRKE
ncbi:protein atonal homolog 8 [Cheilinus undulatus]|uniref:protein atonal homolog 8 n=1 Tax=Cheilinus undulatus TaxID=241271 RepID=UPI001BD548D9|nr:protein atonal homolog 8 [Cheilinus undulatus]